MVFIASVSGSTFWARCFTFVSGCAAELGQVMKPEPRTARRYTVDSKCELAAHNLTIDSSTGGFGVLRWSLAGEAYSVSGVGA